MKNVVTFEDVYLSYTIKSMPFKKHVINAVNGLSFTLRQNEMLSLIGYNGSGKTTTLSLVAGILAQDRGRIVVSGKVVPFLGLGIGFNPELTVKENVYLYGAVMGFSGKRTSMMFDSIMDFSELREFLDLKVKELSTGMYVRLGFSVAIHTEPDILIIDEVLSVGDILFQRKCLEAISRIKAKGVSILFVSHDMGLVSRFSDRVILLNRGSKVSEGLPGDVIDDYVNLRRSETELSANRRGSGEVEIIKHICLKESRSFSSGEKAEFEVDYRNNSRVEKAIAGFAIYDDKGTLVSGPNIKDYEGRFLKTEAAGKFIFGFSTKMLNPGKYFISIALYDETNRFPYDHIDFADSFIISGERKHYHGVMKIEAEWKTD